MTIKFIPTKFSSPHKVKKRPYLLCFTGENSLVVFQLHHIMKVRNSRLDNIDFLSGIDAHSFKKEDGCKSNVSFTYLIKK